MAAAFLTRAKVKSVLGVPAAVTRHDADIDLWLEVAESAVCDYLGTAGLTLTDYDETFDVDDPQDTIALSAWPVSSAVVTNNGALVVASDYYVDALGYLRLTGSGAAFTPSRQKVTVSHSSGYSPVEEKFVMAAAIVAAALFSTSRHAGFVTERMASGGYQYRLDDSEFPKSARALLNSDRRVFAR